jgi:hypothetical protein
LLASKDKTLLVWWYTLHIFNHNHDIFYTVPRVNIESDDLPCQSLHKDMQTEMQVNGSLVQDVVVSKSTIILKLFIVKDETLLAGLDFLLVLNHSLHITDSIMTGTVQNDGFVQLGNVAGNLSYPGGA